MSETTIIITEYRNKICHNYDINIPFSAAALMALMFAVPLILYMKEFDPKPPTQDTCNNFSRLLNEHVGTSTECMLGYFM